ncbi:CHAT domain-containing WD40 repeat protein [Streptomyces syringium]|uniref:CHAT domain-containing WD40 repeat protein n=1 Tax=Streptomyces syringium TaxID=76729 RepID=UPI003453FCEF
MSADFDFVVEMSEAPGGYSIEVTSPCGEDCATVCLDAHELLSRLPTLEAAVLGSAARSRGAGSELEMPVRQVGGILFNAVFQNAIKALYLSSRQKAKDRDQRLRIVLRVRSPELAALPWEFLHDPKLGGYLCLHHPIIRYVEVLEPVSPLRVEPPLRILGMVALPGSLGALDAEDEQKSLTAALRPLIDEGTVQLDWVPGQTKEHLFQALLGGCHVLHFIGHGRFDDRRRQGMILFADEQGREDPLHAEALGSLISVAEPSPRLVVLNSCETGTSNTQELFSSTAAELEHTVPAVVAMQFPVTDKGAVLFSRSLYLALAANRPVDEAVRTGRIALRAEKDDSLECFTPVLYQRSSDARLFDFTRPGKRPPPPETIVEEIDLPLRKGNQGEESPGQSVPSAILSPAAAPAHIAPRPEIDTDRWVVSMAVHPQGRLLVTGARKSVRLWDVTTGQVTWDRRFGGWSTMVNATAFSADGRKLATGSTENIARIWDMATKHVSLELTHGHFVNAVDFDSSASYLASGSADAAAHIWDLSTGTKILSLRHARAVRDVKFSPDGQLLLTACEDRSAYVWNTGTGEQKLRIPHEDLVLRVAFSPDGRRIATCSEDRTVQIWETETCTPLFCIEHRSGVRALAFSPDSSLIATGSADGAVGVWLADTGEPLLQVKHKRSVNAVAFYPDGQYLASAGEDKLVRSTRLPETNG